MELMRQTLRENQGFEGYLFSMGGITTEPSIQITSQAVPKLCKDEGVE